MQEHTSTTTLPVQRIASEFDGPVAADYLLRLFEPSDRIALMFLKKGEDVRHKFLTAEEAANSGCLEQLQKANAAGWNIYVCMNPLKADRRIKENIAAVRTVYIDVDENGKAALDKVFQSSLVPEPNFVLQSSPDKFYFVWRVEPGLSASEQESLLKALVQQFGADPAATDATRVLRLPGFANHKYPDKPLVEITHWGPESVYARDQFKVSLKPVEKKIEHDTDPRFLALREAVGFRPLVRRMNTLPDSRSHVESLDLDPGDLYSCPFHEHSDFTPNFGAIRENALMAHCLGKCGGSWDAVSAVAQFDNLKTQFEAAKVICKEEKLDYEQFFPKDPKVSKSKTAPAKKEISSEVSSQSEQNAEELEPEITEEPLPEFPQITGSIAEFADALCPDIPREFKIMAAVTRIGLMLTGRVSLANETHLQPRFYTCAIADKGRGKSASNNEVGRRLNALGDYHSTPSVDSGPALVDVFSEQDANIDRDTSFAKVLLNPDEMIDLFEKAKLSREGRNSIFTELLRLFEGNETGNRARKAGQPIELSNAALAVIGSATPEGYDQMWVGSRGASGGLQSRFTLVATTAPPIPTRPRPSDEEKIKAVLERIKTQTHCSNVLLSMTDEASGMLQDWWNKTPREKTSEVRIPDIVKRFLMVLAVTNDRDTIDQDLMTVGIQFGEYQITVRDRFMPVDSFSWTQAFENKIITIHERHGAMTRDKCRKLVHPDRSPGGFGEFLKAYGNLVHAGVLTVKGKTQRASKYGLGN
jgi:RepB DNA-primase N-terminal domain/Protein of unknown function (DUF3987)